MTYLLSEPIEELIKDNSCDEFKKQCDVLIVGSGYGGAIAAMRLANGDEGQKGSVFVFERGNEYKLGDFPESMGEIPGHVQFLRPTGDMPIGYAEALFDFRIGDPISVLVGNGLGGGSLINGNVALEPDDAVFSDPAWPAPLRHNRAALAASFDEVRTLLGVNNAEVQGIRKYDALARLADSLGAACQPAPITVTQQDGCNAVGIRQNACVRCANCVTGCNVGAKNTLAMNMLPLAKSRGAKIYTGATVLTVEPDGAPDGKDGWRVRFRRTATSKTVLHQEVFTLRAKAVILAAGTLGSTEILLRSKKRGMKFSKRLGSRFSTNGDVLAFGYAQRKEVNAVAHADFANPAGLRSQRGIGPTITGYFKADGGFWCAGQNGARRRQVTIEDGAVPSALAHAFGEIVTTASVPKRYVKDGLPAWFDDPDNCDKDPLAVHPGALRHSQVLLGMGDDQEQWNLELRPSETTPTDWDRATIRIVPTNNHSATASVFQDIDRCLEGAEKKGGFDGGDYLPNPLWKLMPDQLSLASDLPAPGGRLLTVHPLGGCPMGDDINSGVVNHYGQVFMPDEQDSSKLYKGLYVMDGAILPCALGVNPFLTIAALAHRNAAQVAHCLKQQPHGIGRVSAGVKQHVEETLPSKDPEPLAGHSVAARFRERLIGNLSVSEVPERLIESFGQLAQRLTEKNRFVIDVQIDIQNVLHWLRTPDGPLPARAWLFVNTAHRERVQVDDPIRDEDLRQLAVGCGSVELLFWNRPTGLLQKAWRALLALLAFIGRRTIEFIRNLPKGKFIESWRVASNYANWRNLRYTFTLPTERGPIILQGTKQLAYAPFKKNPWTAVGELPITLGTLEGDYALNGTMRVDLVGLTQRAPFQIQKAPNTPISLAAMASAGAMMLRTLFQTHFWSFGAPYYPEKSPIRNRKPGTLYLEDGTPIEPKEEWFDVPVCRGSQESLKLRLLRYQPSKVERGSVLIVHGLATSSLAFATDTIDVNLATYLCRNHYDVWLLDYRLSIALPYACRQWTMDQIAHSDMRIAVERVYKETHGPIHVFAHCIGAGSLAMAILSGDCHDRSYVNKEGRKVGRSRIKTLVTHAVHPWMMPSEANHAKINAAAFFKDAIRMLTFDSVLPVRPTANDVLIDRIAGSIPWSSWRDRLLHRLETGKRKGKEICNRLTLFYGFEWWHKNIACKTHRGIADLLGVVNLETVRQIYFILYRRRLTSRSGANEYVRKENFDRYWTFPTLFAHGHDSQLYNPVSAERSCLRLQELRKLQEGKFPAPNYDAYWLDVPDCGHMDFLFGENAHKGIYEYLDAFFRMRGEHGASVAQASRKEMGTTEDRISAGAG